MDDRQTFYFIYREGAATNGMRKERDEIYVVFNRDSWNRDEQAAAEAH
jgi:hypothetical protein